VRSYLHCTLWLLIIALAGCSSSPPTGDVSGKVSFEGTPIGIGSITFFPEDGRGPTAGGSITNGKYEVKAIPVGNCKVQITGAKDLQQRKINYDEPNAAVVTTSSELLPPNYSDQSKTELRYEVKTGTQHKDFALTK
jgi:hypothetical protein